MSRRRRKLALFVTGVLIGTLLSGCGTIHGFGQDLSDTASWLKDHHDNGWARPSDQH